MPLNIPTHIQGQGYADANLIIPEVVSQIRVLEGPYDPRQGDAAIVGSAYFDLGVPERGGLVRGSYGSFNQKRLVGIFAPKSAGPETFVAVELRVTRTASVKIARRRAGTVNAQYGVDLSAHDHLRVLAIGRAASATLPGVVREDDVAAGRIGFYDSYPYYAENQSVRANAVILGGELRHLSASGAVLQRCAVSDLDRLSRAPKLHGYAAKLALGSHEIRLGRSVRDQESRDSRRA